MFLVDAIGSDSDPHKTKLRIATLAYFGLQLRDAVFSRVETDQEEITKLKNVCQHFFNANSLLLRVSTTVWTIGYAMPYHAQILYDKYGLGLGLNSMQGRKAEHVKLSQYSRHARFVCLPLQGCCLECNIRNINSWDMQYCKCYCMRNHVDTNLEKDTGQHAVVCSVHGYTCMKGHRRQNPVSNSIM